MLIDRVFISTFGLRRCFLDSPELYTVPYVLQKITILVIFSWHINNCPPGEWQTMRTWQELFSNYFPSVWEETLVVTPLLAPDSMFRYQHQHPHNIQSSECVLIVCQALHSPGNNVDEWCERAQELLSEWCSLRVVISIPSYDPGTDTTSPLPSPLLTAQPREGDITSHRQLIWVLRSDPPPSARIASSERAAPIVDNCLNWPPHGCSLIQYQDTRPDWAVRCESRAAEQVNLLQVLITGRANQGQWPDCQVCSNRSSDNTKDQLNYDDFGPHILPTGFFFSFPDITKCEILSWLLALVNVRRCDIPPTQHYQARHHDQLWLNSPSI